MVVVVRGGGVGGVEGDEAVTDVQDGFCHLWKGRKEGRKEERKEGRKVRREGGKTVSSLFRYKYE